MSRNRCLSCGRVWRPSARVVSAKCPDCRSRHVELVRVPCGVIAIAALVSIAAAVFLGAFVLKARGKDRVTEQDSGPKLPRSFPEREVVQPRQPARAKPPSPAQPPGAMNPAMPPQSTIRPRRIFINHDDALDEARSRFEQAREALREFGGREGATAFDGLASGYEKLREAEAILRQCQVSGIELESLERFIFDLSDELEPALVSAAKSAGKKLPEFRRLIVEASPGPWAPALLEVVKTWSIGASREQTATVIVENHGSREAREVCILVTFLVRNEEVTVEAEGPNIIAPLESAEFKATIDAQGFTCKLVRARAEGISRS